MSRVVNVGGLTLGAGRPVLCVPLTGRNRAQILAQAAGLPACTQMAEWRADYDEEIPDAAAVCETGRLLQGVLRERSIPMLFTCRSPKEGGFAELSDEAYAALYREVLRCGFADLVDVEYGREAVRGEILSEAKRCVVVSIVSCHDTERTGAEEALAEKLRAMEAAGGDVVKLAVTPREPADVAVLLKVSAEAEGFLSVPRIVISMGEMGVPSRIFAETFGSAVTFASAGEASAPGQLPAERLAELLEEFHR